MQTIQTPKNKIEVKNFCDGDWYDQKGESFDIVSPYTGQVIGSAKDSTAQDIDLAVKKAQAAYLLWSKTPIKERSAVMFKFREILLRDIKTIAHRISSECGKNL
ncbi:MAG: aldehyde dehydrogenase family protein, partial [Bdellovibrionota bacterium]